MIAETGSPTIHAMKPVPALHDREYPFREDYYPVADLAMSEAPQDLAEFLIATAKANGIELIRDEIVELICRGDGVTEQRFTVYWPAGSRLHILVPKQHVVGKA